MKMPTDKSWYAKMAAKEGDHEISAGRRLTSTINPTPEEIAEIERLQLEALPAWARDRISQQDAELERVRREVEELKAGIKRLSDEEEMISETGSDEALTAVHLAARLAEAEELARVMEAEANQLREVSISNRQRAEAYRKARNASST